ncbi:MAG: hypothetical protein A2Z91_01255 [Deltaproteobacteria bacterium GWA2_38_16]|nr:MAG: hypothetical protein A2Z91_01255 [Deltaproteobacteria bacterium GWA2_38_16]OGQ02175.1 MAG: hypothetical protein A3D19_05330 [Deltaproteobacteria bacterium RIFCSPHIGHO2_02_FULL_38_15]OGQ34479.1 MAG: hypothetical protein A3A72_04915 [Deltaproteobacteria bacterium RIFCSPLOWO2_01_FULL_38_9]OGQ61161.1 MAG: hypothetical protein A3G92_05930 [Deltaproteobacteria bacterium RIFCSPLOWO2_12_FULL_38_8]HBQ21968.1 hypothetical protein [Deltaproteobacteria bacterium]
MTLANSITLFRIFLIPVFIYSLMAKGYWVASVLIVLAALSDLADGYVARRYGQITKVGILLDPMADKLLAISAFIFFAFQGVIPLWFVLMVFYRDFSLLVGVVALRWCHKKSIVSSQVIGKISAAIHLILIFILCVMQVYPSIAEVKEIFFILAMGMTVISFISYSIRWFKLFYEGGQ